MKKLILLLTLLASASLAFGQGAVATQANAGTTGTTLNYLASVNTSNAMVLTSSTTVPAWIVTQNAGTTGNPTLAVTGQANCNMDATIASAAAGDYVIANSSTGQCHPQSAAPTFGTYIVGYLASGSTTSGSVALVNINPSFYTGGAIPLTALATQATNTGLANTTSGTAVPSVFTIPSGIQNYVQNTGYNQATAHQVEILLACADSSGSGTAQSCTTSPSFTPATNDCVIYSTTTTNSGTGLTATVDSLGAKSIAIAGASGWTTTLTAGIIPASKPLLACYDGTNWDVSQTGTNGATLGAATASSLLATGIVDGLAPVTDTTGTTATLGAGTYQSGYTLNQEATAATAVTYTLPATVKGAQYCAANSIVSGTGAPDTGVLTVYPPSGSYVIYKGVINTIGGGGTHGIASGGAAADEACFRAIDSTHWTVTAISGTWTEN